MLAVHVSSVTTGQEICVISAGRDWSVHELSVKLVSQQEVLLHTLTFLKGSRVLEKLELLRDLLDAEEDTLELQLLRRSWVVTVVDGRDEGSKEEGESAGSSTASLREVDVEAYPECLLAEFGVKIAKKLGFEPAIRPELALAGRTLAWDYEKNESLADLGIQPGTRVRVVGTADLALVCKGRPALQSRRSEFLESDAALCLMDQCQAGTLLRIFAQDKPSSSGPLEVLHPGLASSCDGLWRLPGLLSDSEASRIIVGSMHLGMAPMAVDDFAGTRRYQRLVVQDEVLAQELWLRAKPLVEEALAEQSKRPLGFGCVQGDWELEGLNSCFRVNSYGPEGFLKPHRDAPFSPDVNVRSLCTLLIPLSSAGRTRFFHPVQPKMDYRGMTLKEELDARGGLAAGFHASDIFLSVGSGLLFGQSLLHEGIPADADHHKALLRTDVLVRRKPPIPGVLLTPAERKDQTAALQLFREAQHRDLREQPSNDLYERALSYRYFHPSADAAESLEALAKPLEPDSEDQPLLPSLLLERFPHFAIPELDLLNGAVAAFKLPKEKPESQRCQGYGAKEAAEPAQNAAQSTAQSTAKHLRVTAMYALHLLGHHAYGENRNLYTVNFDPQLQKVTALPLEELLLAAFDARPCHGAVYNVMQRQGSVEKDFEAAVDRTHMALQHGCTHTGQDLLAGLKSEAFATEYDIDFDLRVGEKELDLQSFTDSVRLRYEEDFAREWPAPASATPDWQRYLTRLLSDEAGVPGLDLVATAIGERCQSLDDEGTTYEEDNNITVQASPMNHLVFDFSRHKLVVQAQPHAQSQGKPYDPEALWLELLEQWKASSQKPPANCVLGVAGRCGKGQSSRLTFVKDTAETVAVFVDGKASRCLARGDLQLLAARRCVQWSDMDGTTKSWMVVRDEFQALASFMDSPGFVFERYEVSLAALARKGSSFHHAGEQNGVTAVLTVQVEHAGLALSDHTSTVLCGVTADQLTGAAMVWTIYHGLSAL